MRLFSPCAECIVKPCCSQVCDEKVEYEKDSEIFKRLSTHFAKEYLEQMKRSSILLSILGM